MAVEIVIPKLGMTMKEGTLAEWLVADGATVVSDQPLYRLTTEKLDHEEGAPGPGIVRHEVGPGTTLPTGTRIAWLLADGEAAPEVSPHAGSAAADSSPAAAAIGAGISPPTARRAVGERLIASPAARRLAAVRGVALDAVAGTGPGGRIVLADVPQTSAPVRSPAGVAASPAPSVSTASAVSPVARNLAAQLGVDLATVEGTGPGGRITKDDVSLAARTPTRNASVGAPAAAFSSRRALQRTPLRGMRGVIAERMHASLRDMAQLTLTTEIAVDELVKLRTGLVAEWAGAGIKPSYTDLVIRAVAKALLRHPNVNSSIEGDEIVEQDAVNIGMAVSLEAGLIVPVVRNADAMALRDLAGETSRLATSARAGKLTYDEIDGSTFSVTALGAQGIDAFTPIVNPPNVAILGIGRIRDGVRWDADRPVREQRLVLSLTIDHRALDGAPAADFLGTVRELLEAPYRLLV